MSAWLPFLAWEGITGNADRNGLETIVVPYYVPTLKEARTFIPDDLAAEVGLPIRHRQYRQEWGNGKLIQVGKDGAYRLDLTCEGMQNPNDDENGVQFTGDGSVSEDPATEHPDILQLVADYGDIDENGQPVFNNATIGNDQDKNPLYGFKKYLVPGLTWTKTFLTTRPAASLTRRLGKIDRPERAPDGYLPEIPDNFNWLLIVAKPEWKTNCWRVTKTWSAGNWPKPVYARG